MIPMSLGRSPSRGSLEPADRAPPRERGPAVPADLHRPARGHRDRLRAPGHGDAPADDPRPLQVGARRPRHQGHAGRSSPSCTTARSSPRSSSPAMAAPTGSRPAPPTPSPWPSATASRCRSSPTRTCSRRPGCSSSRTRTRSRSSSSGSSSTRCAPRTSPTASSADPGVSRPGSIVDRGLRQAVASHSRNYDPVLQRDPGSTCRSRVWMAARSTSATEQPMLDGMAPTPRELGFRGPAGVQHRRHHVPPARLLGAHRPRAAVDRRRARGAARSARTRTATSCGSRS